MDRFAVFFPLLFSFLDNTSSSPNTHASSLRSSVRPCIPRGDRSDAPPTRTSTADGHSTTMAGRGGGGERKDLGRTKGGFSKLRYIILCYNNTPSRIALNGFVWCIHNWTDFREFFTRDLCELINIAVHLLHACVHI